MSQNIRNIAVIAHVDHGKTTLVDALLKQTHVFRQNQEEMGKERILDSNELEREKGITIMAKVCAITYKDTHINIIDTPGHVDFSGEVERTLGMADGALLIIDAQEGPMPQTRFVLKKALELGLKIIVVINKIDKPLARPNEALQKTESLFLELATKENQLDFPHLFAIGRKGIAFNSLPSKIEQDGNITPLLESIIENVPSPSNNPNLPFKMLVTSLDYDSHIGRIVIGKVEQGKIQTKDKIILSQDPNKTITVERVTKASGLEQIEAKSAEAGEIIAIAGADSAKIGMTLTSPDDPAPLSSPVITDPTIHMTLGPNTSLFAGREGKFTTSRPIDERLTKEPETNISLRVE